MPPRPTPDPGIGERIRVRRQLRSWSVRYAADRAGVSHSTWSRIERGLMSVDNRFLLADIAAALECPVTELTGQSPVPTSPGAAAAEADVHAVRLALIETDLDEDPDDVPRPLAVLE